MRLLFVIQRYGREALGGSEHYCRELAEGLAARGHVIEVLTSCAVDYQGWVNAVPAGSSVVNGVTVHRFPVEVTRDQKFYYLTERAHGAALLGRPLPEVLEDHWMRAVGPTMIGMEDWLRGNIERFDAAAIITYQFAHAVRATEVIASGSTVPIVLHPTAHEDVTLALEIFTDVFQKASGLVFLTAEERDLVYRRFGGTVKQKPAIVSGVGIPDAPVVGAHQRADFRSRHRIESSPFALCLGRMDENKGFVEVVDAFERYKRWKPGRLKLLLIGGGDLGGRIGQLSSEDVMFLGQVSDAERDAALAEARVFIHPSLFESFSIVVCEAWQHRTPVLVRDECAVLRGQVNRSGGGLCFRGKAEFDVMLDALANDLSLGESLGRRGSRYVETHYRWEKILDGYERFVGQLTESLRTV